jgi:hypothetical protein
VHSKAKEAVDLWLERSHLASNPSAPLFPSFGKNRETIDSRRLDRRSVLKLVEKRAKASGILKRVCCHSFRATGVTIEIAQRIAGHTLAIARRFNASQHLPFRSDGRILERASDATRAHDKIRVLAKLLLNPPIPVTTRIYDRSGDRLTLEEIERVQIGKKHRFESYADRAFRAIVIAVPRQY